MNRTFTLFELLLITGIINGTISALIIWFSRKKSTDKVILSVLLTIFNLVCVKILILSSGLSQVPPIRYFPLPFDLAIQPLIYLYILSLTRPAFRLTRRHLLHFVPFAISLAYSLFIYASVLPHQNVADKDFIANRYFFNPVKETEDFLSIVSAIVYWALSFYKVTGYRQWLFTQISNTDFPTYGWLKNILSLFSLFFIFLTVNILLDHVGGFGKEHFIHWQFFFIYTAILIYYLGHRGQRLPDPPFPNLQSISQPDAQQEIEEKNLPDNKSEEVKFAILHSLDVEKIYLDPELNLQGLAKKIQHPPAMVSSVINKAFEKNFRNLINEYRVQAVKEKLAGPGFGHLSLLGIAYECGFNSEASFYRIFKQHTGISPKEFITRLNLPSK